MRPPLLDHVSPAEDGVYHPPAQRHQAKLPTRRHLRHHVAECPRSLPGATRSRTSGQSVGQWAPPNETAAQRWSPTGSVPAVGSRHRMRRTVYYERIGPTGRSGWPLPATSGKFVRWIGVAAGAGTQRRGESWVTSANARGSGGCVSRPTGSGMRHHRRHETRRQDEVDRGPGAPRSTVHPQRATTYCGASRNRSSSLSVPRMNTVLGSIVLS